MRRARQAIGVDIESLRPIEDCLGIARRLFCRSEYVSLKDAPQQGRDRAFLTLWTRKESVVKATGLGLTMPLDGFDVEVAADRPAALLRLDGDAAAADHWTMIHLEPARGYVGALAGAAPAAQVSCRTGCWEEGRGSALARPAGLPS